MGAHEVHNGLIVQIKQCLSPLAYNLYVEKENIGLIKVTSEFSEGLAEGRYPIAHADMVLPDNNKPILIIEPETSSSPKTFGRSVPVYSMAGEISLDKRKYPIIQPVLLMIVVPDHKSNVPRKRSQLKDMQNRLRRLVASEESKLKDLSICQISDFKEDLNELLTNNGYSSIANTLNKDAQ